MIGVAAELGVYLSSFEALGKRAAGPPWLERVRKAAFARFAELGFPTTHIEDWRFTNVAPIARIPFAPAPREGCDAPVGGLEGPMANFGGPRLVFLNGRFCRELSSTPAGVRAGSLAEAFGDAAVEEHLARYARHDEQAFVALNTAFLEDGAFVEIPKGAVIERPIHLLYVQTGAEGPTVSHPRNLLLVGREGQASFVETYLGLADAIYFTNAVSEIVIGDNAVVEHYKLQEEGREAFHVATIEVRQERASSFTSHSVSLGGSLARNDTNVVLGGEGAETTLNGLYATAGGQHVDHHTTLDHAKPHCSSRELYKGILDGHSTAVFNGKIIVRKDAQKTDSKQTNKNLLLSEGATVNTKPQLEIYADDVKCTHGATIGQIDQDVLFYLRSRGVGLAEARGLLTYAFAGELLGRMKIEPIRVGLERSLREWLRNEA